jgi:RNA polymerase sigma factor (sigma-70 family)
MYPSPKDERELISLWKNGDERAFDTLFNRHFAKLHQFARRHTNDPERAEELAMDTLFKIWQQKDTLHQDVSSLSPLLFRILQCAIVDEYRKRKLEISPIDKLIAEPCATEQADDSILTNQLRALYQDGLGKLSYKQKLVFEMRNDGEMSYKDIAHQLELSTKTVDRHLTDAVSTIRKHVSKFLTFGMITLSYFFL